MNTLINSLLLIPIIALSSFSQVPFEKRTISTKADLWWARAAVDINGDGLLDIALQDHNGHGGWLGWLEGRKDGGEWQIHIIAKTAPNGQPFAAGDIDAGDIDNDGDIDVIGIAHPGEWDEGGAPSTIYWFENPNWKAHEIGEAPAFVKDVNLADMNGDGKLDVVTATFVKNNLKVFRQDSPEKWTETISETVTNLHEGMDVGDAYGDGILDVLANGYWIVLEEKDLSKIGAIYSIHDQWHNQEGDWSRNASKHLAQDIDGDGNVEVFITHSERKGYPLAWYKRIEDAGWKEHIIKENFTAAHTIQVFDADNDGDFDVLSGMNRSRAQGLGETKTPVILFLNEGDNLTWKEQLLTNDGIYNGQAADFDGDGDIDIFRYATHDATEFELWINKTKQVRMMKTLVFAGFMMCIGMLAIADDPKPIKLYIEDFAFLEGEWEGELEYLDYQDNQTKIKLPLTLVITKKTSAEDYTQYLHIKFTFKEPNGSLSFKEDDLTIMKDGNGIILDGEWKATQKKVMKDKKKHEFVFVGNKKDNNIQSQIRQSMTLADEVLAVKVEVKHENTDEWFVRSNYILTKKK